MNLYLYFDIIMSIYFNIMISVFGPPDHDQLSNVILIIKNLVVSRFMLHIVVTAMSFSDFSTFSSSLYHLLLIYLIHDMWFWATHRLMHTKVMFRLAHCVHHYKYKSHFLMGFCVHPIELFIVYFGAFLSGPIFLQLLGDPCSENTFIVWALVATFYIFWSHTNLDLPWILNSKTHDIHHKKYTKNFSTGPADWIFGTYENVLE